jgi:DNA-binding IclR family transcriptional regulator
LTKLSVPEYILARGESISEGNSIKSVVKAMTVLECFLHVEQELGISEIAKGAGISKTNAFEIVHSFENLGYLEQNPVSRKYSLSVKMLVFSSAVNSHIGYYRVVYDIMDELSEKVNNIVYFSVPHGLNILYLYSSHPKAQRANFPFRPVGGEICPMYCSSMGKAMLAFSDTELMEKMRSMKFTKFTEKTITDYGTLTKQIDEVKKSGYAIDRGEHQFGVGAVGVPILNHNNKLIAAMSICGTVSTFTKENTLLFSELLKEAAFQIRVRL